MSSQHQNSAPSSLAPEPQPGFRFVKETPLPHVHPQKGLRKCTTEDGTILVKKEQERWELLESEVRMLYHATGQMQVKGPKLRDMYLDGTKRVMITDFDPGVTLHSVWKKISSKNKKLIIQQLRVEVLKMRESTQPLIGRVGWDRNIVKNDPYFDPYYPGAEDQPVTFFESEAKFDQHKVELLRASGGDAVAGHLEKLIQPLQGQYSGRFVLTHGDLHSENIHVRCLSDSKGIPVWELSGILDWGRSGFYPEYMEYATAMKTGPYHPYWQKVLKEVLKGLECSKQRVKAEELATHWAV